MLTKLLYRSCQNQHRRRTKQYQKKIKHILMTRGNHSSFIFVVFLHHLELPKKTDVSILSLFHFKLTL